MIGRCIFVALVMSLSAVPTFAANHYIRDGGSGNITGTGNCADWTTTNACDQLPSTLIRGDTYYLADGNYPARAFNTPISGSTVITIKKALAADHGTDTGWVAGTMGVGQANFTGTSSISTNDWVIDGATRNENDWFAFAAYGISFGSHAEVQQLTLGGCGSPAKNVMLKYVYIKGYNVFPFPSSDMGAYAIVTDPSDCGASAWTGLLFHRILVRYSNNQIMPRNSTGTIIEYSAGELAIGDGGNHGDTINAYFSVDNMVVRYSKFRYLYTTACSQCGSTGWIPYCCGSNGLEVYGNWVYHFRGGDGLIGYSTCSPSNCPSNTKVYNNTFDRASIGPTGTDCCDADGGVQLGNGTNNFVYNNIWMATTGLTLTGSTHNFNAFYDASAHGEANAQQNFATSNFVNYATQNYHLTTDTTAGTALSTPYNTDMDGCTRTTPDRGAFEFPTCPSGLSISIMNGVIRSTGMIRVQ